jgi:hypothetical protein
MERARLDLLILSSTIDSFDLWMRMELALSIITFLLLQRFVSMDEYVPLVGLFHNLRNMRGFERSMGRMGGDCLQWRWG